MSRARRACRPAGAAIGRRVSELATLLKRISIVFWVSYFGLILEITLNTFVWHQEGRVGGVVIWLIRIGPLLAFLPWLLARNPRTLIWLCFLLMIYFLVAVPNAMLPITVWINYVEVALVVSLFVSAMLYSRWLQRDARQGNAKE